MIFPHITIAGILLLSFVVAGCSKADESEQLRIPGYPNAVHDQTHGMEGVAKVTRLITSDSFDEVLAFYTEQLKEYNPEITPYELEGGRQTAIKVSDRKKREITVVVQEFIKEEKVAIVYMGIDF